MEFDRNRPNRRRPNPAEALYRTFHLAHVLYRVGNHGIKTMSYWLHLLKDSKGRTYDPWACNRENGKPLSIIEAGCGNGLLCKVLSQMELDVTGMDIVGLEYIYDRTNYKFIQKDLTETPYNEFKDRQFDYCLSFDVLEHIGEKSIPKILKEWARISNNMLLKVACDGKPPLHITVHDRSWWEDKLNECCPEFSWRLVRNFEQYREPRTGVAYIGILNAPLFYGQRVKDED